MSNDDSETQPRSLRIRLLSAGLSIILLALPGCGGQGGAFRYLSVPPQPSPDEPLRAIGEIVTKLGFISHPVETMGTCGWFEDEEYVAGYTHSRYPDIHVNIIRAIPTKRYCFGGRQQPSYAWMGGYTDRGTWIGAYTLPPNSSWKPGEHLFRRGILVIQFVESWGYFDPVKDLTPEAAFLLDQIRRDILQRFGPDSVHVFPDESRRRRDLYILP